jgi:hypothetical protein
MLIFVVEPRRVDLGLTSPILRLFHQEERPAGA